MAEAKPLTGDKTSDLGSTSASKGNTNVKTSDAEALGAILEVPLVKFDSADGVSFTLEKKVARKLNFDDETIDGAMQDDEPILLNDIESDIFLVMIAWAEEHVNDEDADDSGDDGDDDEEVKRTDDIAECDNKLLDKLNIPTLFRILKVARNREIKSLLKVVAKKSALQFKNKSVEELRETIRSLKTA